MEVLEKALSPKQTKSDSNKTTMTVFFNPSSDGGDGDIHGGIATLEKITITIYNFSFEHFVKILALYHFFQELRVICQDDWKHFWKPLQKYAHVSNDCI